MIRIKKSNAPPFNECPICGKPDYCLMAEDGTAAICARISQGSVKKAGEAGWLHILKDNPDKFKQFPRNKKLYEPPKPLIGFMTKWAMHYHLALPDPIGIAHKLGVSPEALDLLLLGWEGQAHTFPMKDGKERIIGIRLRTEGAKFSVRGSQNGLFWPVGIKSRSRETLFVCEGPTDTATLLDLGFQVIGRASCNTGFKYIKEAIEHENRTVVIMADKDEAKKRPDGSEFYPGQAGAQQLAKDLKPFVKSVRVIKPPKYKDIREWYQHGCTREAVMLLAKNARFL